MRAPGHRSGPLPVLFQKSIVRRLGVRPQKDKLSFFFFLFFFFSEVGLYFKYSRLGNRSDEIAHCFLVSRGKNARRSHCRALLWNGNSTKAPWTGNVGFFSSVSCSHLASRDKLQRSQGNLEVGSVGLEIVESLSNLLLKLGRVLPRRAVGGDLVQGLGAHLGW